MAYYESHFMISSSIKFHANQIHDDNFKSSFSPNQNRLNYKHKNLKPVLGNRGKNKNTGEIHFGWVQQCNCIYYHI